MRFGMEFVELKDIFAGKSDFAVFNDAAYIGGICAEGCATYTRKQIDELTNFVKSQQVGAKGLVYARVGEDGSVKSSVDKFYTQEVLQEMKEAFGAKPGDLILILSGEDANKTRKQLCELRLLMGERLGLRDKNKFALLWVIDFPMFEWSEEEGRLMAMHHPFTSPKPSDIEKRCGSRRRFHTYPRCRAPGKNLQGSRIYSRKSPGTIRIPHERLQVWSSPSRRSGIWPRPFRKPLCRAGQHP